MYSIEGGGQGMACGPHVAFNNIHLTVLSLWLIDSNKVNYEEVD